MRSGSAANDSGRTFSATSRPRRVSRAQKTSPMPPAPTGKSTAKCPSRAPVCRGTRRGSYRQMMGLARSEGLGAAGPQIDDGRRAKHGVASFRAIPALCRQSDASHQFLQRSSHVSTNVFRMRGLDRVTPEEPRQACASTTSRAGDRGVQRDAVQQWLLERNRAPRRVRRRERARERRGWW